MMSSKVKALKIIQITFGDLQSKNIYDPEDDRFFTASWANTFAEKIKKFDENLNIECWRHDSLVNFIRERKVNGVNVKLFPVIKHKILSLSLKELMKELKEEQQEFEIILHLHSFYNIAAFALINKFKNLPVCVTNHGSPPPLPSLSFDGVKKTLKWMLMRRAYRQIDYFFPASNDERAHLLRFMNQENISPTYCLGIDFNVFKPVDKKRVRKELGIPQGAFVLGYTGSLYKLKGFDLVLDLFAAMKKLFATELVCLGATPDDPLYSRARKEDARIFEKNFETLDLPFVLNAADVFLNLTYRNKAFLASGGMGIASIEAMACNIPVVSFALRHFPDPEDVSHVGIIPQDEKDILPSVLYVKENPHKFGQCRATAMKYLTWNTVLGNAVNQYRRLAEKYYSL